METYTSTTKPDGRVRSIPRVPRACIAQTVRCSTIILASV